MLWQHLGFLVYDDSIPSLRCSYCTEPIDNVGDYSFICLIAFGAVQLHITVRNLFQFEAFGPAGLCTTLEAPFLVPGTNLCPADFVEHPTAFATGSASSSPTRYGVTIRSSYTGHTIRHSAACVGKAIRLAEREKPRDFERTVQTALGIVDLPDAATLRFIFTLLAQDILGVSAPSVIEFIKQHATIISMRLASTPTGIESRLWQKPSFTVWSSDATAKPARTPI